MIDGITNTKMFTHFGFHRPLFRNWHVVPAASRRHRRSLVLAFGGAMASAVARAYNGGLGLCPQRGPGAETLVRGSGGEAPQKLNTTIHFISQFSPNFGVILVKFKVSANC